MSLPRPLPMILGSRRYQSPWMVCICDHMTVADNRPAISEDMCGEELLKDANVHESQNS